MPFIDQHRISKSILKKSDSGNNYYSNAGDSDTEKLITDSMSTASICDNETSSCDASANTNNVCTKKHPMSPLFSRQVLESIFLTNNNIERECTNDKGDKKLSVSRKSRILFSDIEGEIEFVKQIKLIMPYYTECLIKYTSGWILNNLY